MKEFANLWPSRIVGIELFQAQVVRHTFAKHMHEEYTIGLNDGGVGRYCYRGAMRRSCPGHLKLLNPGELHTGEAEGVDGWAFRNLYISVPRMEAMLSQLDCSPQKLPYFPDPSLWEPSLRASFLSLFSALDYPASPLEQETRLLEFFAQLLSHTASYRDWQHCPSQPESRAIAQIRAYLEAHYTEPISIHALAQLVNLSPYYLIRTFRQQVGMPPHAYQRHWQLVQVKRSLHSSKPLSELAVDHGFYDQSHLNRAFKRVFGVTPGQYQKGNIVQS